MPSSEMTRSELVRAFVDIGSMLTAPTPLAERMTNLCLASLNGLNCDQISILRIDGDHYYGAYQAGLAPPLAQGFPDYRVDRRKPIVAEIEACDRYLLYNSANTDPTLQRIAKIARVRSVIIVPFSHPDGSPMGYLTVAYREDKPTVTSDEAELAMGIARLVETTLLHSIEVQRRREVSRAMLEVADSERRRLSRDIHDDPLQRILALRIGLEGFREQLADPELTSSVDAFVEQCRTASASLREVMLRTHPNASELADLQEVLSRMVDREGFGTSLQLEFDDARSAESPSYLIPTINRVAEQAARNTLHHAEASVLSVRLADKADGTLLTISDDGRGFDPHDVDATRLGLVSMRERTELLGGTFTVDSMPGSGTRISAWLPHENASDPA